MMTQHKVTVHTFSTDAAITAMVSQRIQVIETQTVGDATVIVYVTENDAPAFALLALPIVFEFPSDAADTLELPAWALPDWEAAGHDDATAPREAEYDAAMLEKREAA